MFSPVHSYVLTGQGTGTSTQGLGVLGVQTFTTFVDNHPYRSYFYGGRSFLSAEGGLTKTWLELGVVGVALTREFSCLCSALPFAHCVAWTASAARSPCSPSLWASSSSKDMLR